MNDPEYPLSTSQIQSQELGYLQILGFLSKAESLILQKWGKEVHDLPRTEDAGWLHKVGMIPKFNIKANRHAGGK